MKIQEAVEVLTKEILNDKDYRNAWVANIAMPFKDEWARNNPEANGIETNKIHDIANKAANEFLDILCMRRD